MWLNLISSIPTNDNFAKWSTQEKSAWLLENMHYLYVSRKNIHHEYTIWIVVDLYLNSGRALLEETLDYLVRKLSYYFYEV